MDDAQAGGPNSKLRLALEGVVVWPGSLRFLLRFHRLLRPCRDIAEIVHVSVSTRNSHTHSTRSIIFSQSQESQGQSITITSSSVKSHRVNQSQLPIPRLFTASKTESWGRLRCLRDCFRKRHKRAPAACRSQRYKHRSSTFSTDHSLLLLAAFRDVLRPSRCYREGDHRSWCHR